MPYFKVHKILIRLKMMDKILQNPAVLYEFHDFVRFDAILRGYDFVRF